ncbi:unnamed protein product [Sphacelaria rigidula]
MMRNSGDMLISSCFLESRTSECSKIYFLTRAPVSQTARVVHLDHVYFFRVKLMPIQRMTYSRRLRVNSQTQKMKAYSSFACSMTLRFSIIDFGTHLVKGS